MQYIPFGKFVQVAGRRLVHPMYRSVEARAEAASGAGSGKGSGEGSCQVAVCCKNEHMRAGLHMFLVCSVICWRRAIQADSTRPRIGGAPITITRSTWTCIVLLRRVRIRYVCVQACTCGKRSLSLAWAPRCFHAHLCSFPYAAPRASPYGVRAQEYFGFTI